MLSLSSWLPNSMNCLMNGIHQIQAKSSMTRVSYLKQPGVAHPAKLCIFALFAA